MILTIVVTYYPEEELLKNNISAFINHVDKVLIWENTPEAKKLQYRFIQHFKIEYCGDGINSISHALNYAWQYARENGYEYLLTMDQDSVWEDFGIFLEKTVRSGDAPEGIWTPQINSKVVESKYQEIDLPITSGMLIKTELINKIGGWNELFEIDSVDDEFIARAHRRGIITYIVKDTKLNQKFGDPHSIHILGYAKVIRNYSALRLYNIFRNNIIVIRMYPEALYIKKNFRNRWIAYIKYMIIFEKQRILKILAIVKGVIAGYRHKIMEQ